MLVIFDRKSDYKTLVRYFHNFIYFNLENYRDNILSPVLDEAYKIWLNILFEIKASYFDLRVAVRNLLLDKALWLFKKRGFENTGKCPTLTDLYYLIYNSNYPHLSREARYRESALNRLKGILNTFGENLCSKSRPNWEVLLNRNIAINIEGIPLDYQNFFIAYISAKIMHYRILNGKRDGQLRNIIVIDEASTVFKQNVINNPLSDMFRLAREYGMCFLILTQSLKDLDHSIMANTSKKIIVGGLGSGIDYKIFGSSIGLPYKKIEFLKKRTLPGQACVYDYRYPEAFTFKIPHFQFNKEVSDIMINERFEQYKDVLFYPSPSGEDETKSYESRTDTGETKTNTGKNICNESLLVLQFLSTGTNCIIPQTLMFKKLNIKGGAKMNRIKTELEKFKYINVYQLQIKKSKVNFWWATPKAREEFNLPDVDMPGKGGPLHKIIGFYVKKWALQMGYTCQLEAQIGLNKAVDVLLIKDNEVLIIEICISEPLEKELTNITKDFESGFEFSKLIFLTRDSSVRNKLESIIINDVFASGYQEKIKVELAGNYINLE